MRSFPLQIVTADGMVFDGQAESISVRAAGGYIIQLLPGAPEETIEKIEAGIRDAGNVTAMLDAGLDAEGLLKKVLAPFALELLVLVLLSLLVSCLNFYAPIAIGNSFANHKILLSVVFYFALSIFWQVFYTTIGFRVLYSFNTSPTMANSNSIAATMALAHNSMFITIGAMLFTGAVMYVLTWYMLRKHRNLQ